MTKLASLISSTGVVLLLAHASAFAQGNAGPKVADAKPGDVRAYITGALQAPLNTVIDQAKKAVGKNLVIEYGGSRGNLESEILAGNGDFEVAVLLPDVDQKLLAAGKIKPGTYPIAHLQVAFGIRGNATVDLSTPAAIKKTLLAATSVKYAPTGAGAPTAHKILDDLHIADKVKDNSKTRGYVPLTGDQYEINIYPQSEIIANKKLKNLGPVIKDFQVPLDIEATIGKNTRDEASAKALIKFLQGPSLDAVFKADGFERAKTAASN
jgi:molybdate transport system substrate-binding protein